MALFFKDKPQSKGIKCYPAPVWGTQGFVKSQENMYRFFKSSGGIFCLLSKEVFLHNAFRNKISARILLVISIYNQCLLNQHAVFPFTQTLKQPNSLDMRIKALIEKGIEKM